MNVKAGQVWRWHDVADAVPTYSWDELWLVLNNPCTISTMFDALNLETGEVLLITIPKLDTEQWERVA